MARGPTAKTILIAAAVATAAVTIVLHIGGLNLLRAYFVAVNVTTLAAYGYDKLAAGRGGLRVPEMQLHLLAAVGGSPGAFLGQVLLRHKTQKPEFRRTFFAIVICQVLIGLAYGFYVKR